MVVESVRWAATVVALSGACVLWPSGDIQGISPGFIALISYHVLFALAGQEGMAMWPVPITSATSLTRRNPLVFCVDMLIVFGGWGQLAGARRGVAVAVIRCGGAADWTPPPAPPRLHFTIHLTLLNVRGFWVPPGPLKFHHYDVGRALTRYGSTGGCGGGVKVRRRVSCGSLSGDLGLHTSLNWLGYSKIDFRGGWRSLVISARLQSKAHTQLRGEGAKRFCITGCY